MSNDLIEVIEPGLLTTVQDKGRYGYQRYGVPIAGAMDAFALRAANLLVGNEDNAACLEMTVLGPRVKFLADSWIALAGADLTPYIDGTEIPNWQSVRVSEGSVLSFGGPGDGMRGYLAVAGGIDVPIVMGSRSTYSKAEIGGFEGRQILAKDVLKAFAPEAEYLEHSLPTRVPQPVYGTSHEIRVVLGPQDNRFTEAGISTFLGSQYSVSMQSDRMGYRLEGEAIEHVSGPDIVSDGTAMGAVQVPGDGQPIILLADRGTTGGYTKIATVISTDISKLVQAMPGHTVTFKAVTVEESHLILRQQERQLRAIANQHEPPKFSVMVNGDAYEVVDDKGEAIALPLVVSDGEEAQAQRGKATVGDKTFEFEVEIQEIFD